MNILTIGNSFSQDATRYLHQVAKSAGVSKSIAGVAVLILRELGILSICGKKRNAYLYQVKE